MDDSECNDWQSTCAVVGKCCSSMAAYMLSEILWCYDILLSTLKAMMCLTIAR